MLENLKNDGIKIQKIICFGETKNENKTKTKKENKTNLNVILSLEAYILATHITGFAKIN
jgi:hypothetical protein